MRYAKMRVDWFHCSFFLMHTDESCAIIALKQNFDQIIEMSQRDGWHGVVKYIDEEKYARKTSKSMIVLAFVDHEE